MNIDVNIDNQNYDIRKIEILCCLFRAQFGFRIQTQGVAVGLE
jgi:hypothetical protein